MNKLENWPKIGIRDAEGLRDLSDFLQKIIAARETTPSLAVLDFAKENVKTLKLSCPFKFRISGEGWFNSVGSLVEMVLILLSLNLLHL